jgi:O-antigen ligase
MRNNYLFLALYVCIGLVPYFGAADKIVPQVLYLNILNTSAFIYIGFIQKKNIYKEFATSLNNWSFMLYLFFFIWSSITVINSLNISESLRTLGEIFSLLVSFLFLIYFLSKTNNLKNVLFYIILGLITLEVFSILGPYLYELSQGTQTQRGQIYRGYTGNINILAYILLIKFPFLVYFQIIKKGYYKLNFLLTVLIVFIIFSIFATRSAMLTTFFITLLIFCFIMFIKKFHLKQTIRTLLKPLFLPLIIGLILNNLESSFSSSQSFQSRLSTLTEIQGDTSLSQRARYYKAAFESFLEKPIMGKGIGTWEFESIPYERLEMESYVVPYHAHNDYLELIAETGIIGVILYFGMIFFIFYHLLRKLLDSEADQDTKLLSIFLITSFCVYLIDSLFNFPFARIIQQIHLLFLLAVSINFLKLKPLKSNLNSQIISLVLIIMPVSIYSSSRIMKSSQHQAIFLQAFNRGDYSKPSLEVIDKFEMNYLSLSATTLPMSTIKGLYYISQQKYREAIPMFKKGMKDNPYLHISESFLGYSLDMIGEKDSSLYYTKKAFDYMPKNQIHYSNYINSLYQIRDSLTIKKVFSSLPTDRPSSFDEIYLLTMASLVNPGNTDFTLSGLDINIQTGNDRLKRGYYSLQVGESDMFKADEYYQIGLYYFNEENFVASAEYFINADKLNPYELTYKENAANSLLKIGEDERALNILNDLIDNFNSISPKAHYLRGLTLYSMGKKDEGCIDLKYAYDQNFISDTRIYQLACLEN